MANYYHLYMSLFRMDTRGSTFLLLAILVATCAAVFLAGCTGTPSGGSNQTAVPTALAGNTSAANASAAPGANETAAGLGAIMAGTPVPEASVSSVQKATQAGAPTSGTTPVSPTPTKCTTDFTASVTSGVAPLTVTFTATAPCDAQKRTWVFGDGGPMASIEGAKVETYTYDTPGTYTVKLSEKFYSDDPADTLGFYASEKEKVGYVIVTGTTSATGTASITGTTSAKGTATVTGTASVTGTTTVSPTPTHCQADFTASVTSGPAPLTVTFTRTAPCASQKRNWNFGDGGPMSSIEGGPVETYTYETPGTYTVSLYEKFYTDDNIEGFYGDTETKVGFITVTGSAVSPTPTHCQADFTASVTSGPAPLTVTFTRTAPCASQKRNWNFGDGGPMSSIEGGPVETYTYETPGTYTVSLYEKFYTDDNIEGFYGDTETKVGYITVTKGLVVNPSLHITHLPTLKATPLVTLVKPGITLPKEKKEIVVNPIGPVSGNG